MKPVIKTIWRNKCVSVTINTSYMVGEFGKTLHIRVKVEDSILLPSDFTNGMTYKANPDIINSVGGLPLYIKYILDKAALLEEARRSAPIEQQLALDF